MGVLFLLGFFFAVIDTAEANPNLRGPVSALRVYHECMIWKRIDDQSQKQLLDPALGDDESTSLQNINEICGQVEDLAKQMQQQLDGYRDVWNDVMHNPKKADKTRAIRRAYARNYQDYYSRGKPPTPYTICGA